MVSFHGGGTPIARWTAGSYRRRLMAEPKTMKRIMGWMIIGVLVILGWVLLFSYLNSPQFY
jgi:hypothetical protein|tara:strand:+ start:657 stop:839 length:183 start_codon:yes stop_codon:yes gene_type:complete